MILSLFTVREPGHYHQIHRTHQHHDANILIMLGKEWESGGDGQHYEITEGVPMVKRDVSTPHKSTSCEIGI
ncbi:MAG: hypothetical protein B7Z62_08730 [Deltaproteobacteria bacterium 37-65-8]|nr:MAG: hypothetical protein B7Z62_08730 [Deltaproteobacteria bacterium 37-65-8]